MNPVWPTLHHLDSLKIIWRGEEGRGWNNACRTKQRFPQMTKSLSLNGVLYSEHIIAVTASGGGWGEGKGDTACVCYPRAARLCSQVLRPGPRQNIPHTGKTRRSWSFNLRGVKVQEARYKGKHDLDLGKVGNPISRQGLSRPQMSNKYSSPS